MVNILEPHNGTVYDPACGSGGVLSNWLNLLRPENQMVTTQVFMYTLSEMVFGFNGLPVGVVLKPINCRNSSR